MPGPSASPSASPSAEPTAPSAPSAPRRYALPELVVVGRPVSDNRYKKRVITHPRSRGGAPTPFTVYTPEAEAWMGQVAQAALLAIASRASGVPHPRSWPRPLRLTMTLRDGRLDLPNVLKATLDALKGVLDVDDKHYELGGLTRGVVTKQTPRGMTILIESAELASEEPSREELQQTATPGKRATTRARRGFGLSAATPTIDAPQRPRPKGERRSKTTLATR